MPKNSFATKLQYLLRQTNTKNATLAKAVQYDISYISKWLNGKMLPSEKNIDKVVMDIALCLMEGDSAKLLQEYQCDQKTLLDCLKADIYCSYEKCKLEKIEDRFQATQPIIEVVHMINKKIRNSQKVLAVIDLLSLPHESRLVFAGIKNGRFDQLPKTVEYSMVISINSSDCVYDSLFLIHMMTSMSNISFKLYRSDIAIGKMICCMDEQTVSAFLFPGNKDCIAVNELTSEIKIQQSVSSLLEQENLIFRKSTIFEMIVQRDYIQTMISTNVRWILGHATELLLPQDVFEELLEEDDRDTSEYRRLYRISQSVVNKKNSQIMIYESAIANLTIDGIIDFYNRPLKLKQDQIFHCLNYYMDLIQKGSQIKFIDGGFSDNFRYITNPCMFLSDSLCYIRLENNRYKNNILILNDRKVKEMFSDFFAIVWTEWKDVVIEDREQIKKKIESYKESAMVLMNT